MSAFKREKYLSHPPSFNPVLLSGDVPVYLCTVHTGPSSPHPPTYVHASDQSKHLVCDRDVLQATGWHAMRSCNRGGWRVVVLVVVLCCSLMPIPWVAERKHAESCIYS